ncbi:HU family DNA-binding protein (plasmid) [Rhodococcus antarcticus]|jgi:DNA-binding protein HU-beta|uniref:DNA-binding protein HupB n=1 Tax=Rhodococcus antarcticus TaxID=2987751 RepID=A0ABY6P6A8_9NOCA|nr:HU family DNA-binding protein [Rhodococcus antarcticus]UZJ27004.1 HU family DNA-binding protein [Rhodococcus antarcticus]
MNRSQLINAVAAATDLPPAQVEATLSATLSEVRGAVASGDKVQLLGFGTFEPRERAARTARNPATGAQLQLAATRVVGFKVGAPFKQEVAASATTKKATAKKTPAAKTAAKQTPTKASAATTKTAAKKATAKKAPAKKSAKK